MANTRTTFMRAFMDTHALSTSYYLMVDGTNVGVATSIFPCPFLQSPGIHAFWIWNNYTCHPTGQVITPKIYRADGNLDPQFESFTRAVVPVMQLDDIVTTYDGQADLTVVPTLQLDAHGNPVPEIMPWAALPIHPKLACLFMRGLPIKEVIHLVIRLVAMVPQAHQTNTAPLLNWIHAAATKAAPVAVGAEPRSCLHQACTILVPFLDPAVEDWYFMVLEHWVPGPLPQAGQIPNLGAPQGTRQILNLSMPQGAGEVPNPGAPQGGDPQGPAPQGALEEQIVVVLELMQQNQNRPQDDATRAKPYANHEHAVLLLAGGHRPPFVGMTNEDLPVFFKDFQPFRNKTSSAHLFAERYLTDMWLRNCPQSPFLFMTDMLKNFKELGFCGSDPRIMYDLCKCGISLFSVLPQLHDRTSDALRIQMVQYELTHDQHTPQD